MPAGASETLFIPLAGRARVARYEDILDHCTADLLIRRPEGGYTWTAAWTPGFCRWAAGGAGWLKICRFRIRFPACNPPPMPKGPAGSAEQVQ